MKTPHPKRIFFAWVLVSICGLSSCNLLKNMVDRVDLKKALATTSPSVDTLAARAGRNLTSGAVSGLKGFADTLDPDVQRLKQIIDSLGHLTDLQLRNLGITLDSDLIRLKNEIKDSTLKNFLDNLLTGLEKNLNKNTKYLLSNMLQAALDSLSSTSSKQKISSLVTSLLNDSARMAAQKFVSAALQPALDSLAFTVNHVVHEELPFIKNQAYWLLAGVAVLAAALIGWVWFQRRRYARLLEILTQHIDSIPSPDLYDRLTKDIQAHARNENLEPLLRATLKKQGINKTL
jgi:hypothetical protein